MPATHQQRQNDCCEIQPCSSPALKFCHVTCLHFVIREDSDSHRLVHDNAGMRAHLFIFTDEAAEVLLRLTAEPSQTQTIHSTRIYCLARRLDFDSADGCDPEEHFIASRPQLYRLSSHVSFQYQLYLRCFISNFF